MAGPSLPEMEKPPHKTVQELATSNEELPERFIYKDSKESMDAPALSMEIPVVDLSLLTSSAAGEELERLRSALRSWGCFQLVNHGIESSFLDRVREVARQFFALTMEEKKKYSRAADDIEGYGNDIDLSESQILDWTDRLYMLVDPEDQRNLKVWPENPSTFRETVESYSKQVKEITEALLKAMALSLGLKDECFLDQCGERAKTFLRVNFYPPCPRPDLVLGLKSHADGSVITILLQDEEVEGLQFFKNDQWNRTPVIPHALLVNVGDQAEIMSNGMFRSPVHRAVVNSEKERMTLASFYTAAPDKEVGPAAALTDEENPRLYKTVKNYAEIYFQYYQQGKRPIDSVRI